MWRQVCTWWKPAARQPNPGRAATASQADKAGDKRSFPGPFRRRRSQAAALQAQSSALVGQRVLSDGVRDTSHRVARLSEGRGVEGRRKPR